MTSMMESYKQSGKLELIGALLADKNMPTMPDRGAMLGEGTKEQQFGDLKNATLDKIRDALALVNAKASPEEFTVYKQMIAKVAEETATASKEGGFLGFGGEMVSAGEQALIDQIKALLA